MSHRFIRPGRPRAARAGAALSAALLRCRSPWQTQVVRASAALLSLISLACSPPEPEGAPVEANPNMPDRVHRAAPPARPERASVVTCPTDLREPESIERVIGSDCGTVTVYPGYRVDGGSLTVEGGVTLAFMPGAELPVGFETPAVLRVRGTPAAPVRFTAVGPQRFAGAWKGVTLYEHADGSEIAGLEIEFAGTALRGAIHVRAEGVSMEGSTIRDCAGVGVHVTSQGRLVRFRGNRIERVSSPVVLVPAPSAGALAADNVFPEGSFVHVLAGAVRDWSRWEATVPLVIGGPVEVEARDDRMPARLELAPGSVLRFDDDAYINVGYDRRGVLIADAAGQAPIVLTSATRKTSHAWRGVNLYKSSAAVLRNVTFEFGGQRTDRGVLYANSEASVTVEGCTFRDNGGALTIEGSQVKLEAFSGNRIERSHPAFDVTPQVLGQIGPNNQLDETTIRVDGGQIEKDALWQNLGVPLRLVGPVSIDRGATLTIQAGVRMVVEDGFTLGVGEFEGGSLRIEGSAEAPVAISGEGDRRGTWDAIRLYEKAHDNVIEHLHLRNAGGEGAINVAMGVALTIRDVSCTRCFSPTLTWACGAKVSAERVSAGAETPAATLPPFGCEGEGRANESPAVRRSAPSGG